MPYATVADDIKPYLNIDASVTKDDAELEKYRQRAIALLEKHTSRIFIKPQTSETKLFNVATEAWVDNVSDTMQLNWVGEDLIELTEVRDSNDTVIDPSNYRALPYNRLPKHGIEFGLEAFFELTEPIIKVVGFWSYSVDVPEDLNHSIVRLVSHYYKQRDTQVSDFDTIQVSPSGVLMVPSAIPKDVMIIWHEYDRWGV